MPASEAAAIWPKFTSLSPWKREMPTGSVRVASEKVKAEAWPSEAEAG